MLILQSLRLHTIPIEIRPNVKLQENPLNSLTGGFITSSFDVIDKLITYHDVSQRLLDTASSSHRNLVKTDAVLHEFLRWLQL